MRAMILGAVLVLSTAANASDLETLAKEGYGVFEKTSVLGEFTGCDFGKRIPLTDGLQFVCSGYNYHYSYGADVLVLKNVKSGAIKVLIDGQEFDGTLYR
jgi:hypothetical protein